MSRGQVHNALSRGTLPSALSRAVGDTMGSSGLERYGETLTPIINLWERPEWAYLRQVSLLSWLGSPAAVAGEYSGAALVNPVGSSTIAVVETVSAMASVQAQFQLCRVDAATILATYLLDGGRGSQRDTRWTATYGPGRVNVWSGSDAAIIIGAQVDVRANTAGAVFTEFQCGVPFVLTPGYALVCSCRTVNTLLTTVFKWYERQAFPGELE